MHRLLWVGCAAVVWVVSACDEEPRYLNRSLSLWSEDLDNESIFERQRACEALGQMGLRAKKAIPKLIERLDDANASVQVFASNALASMGGAAVNPLEAALEKPIPAVQLNAAAALVQIDHTHQKAKEALSRALSASNAPELRRHAEHVVLSLKQEAVGVLQPLLKGSSDAKIHALHIVARLKDDAKALVSDVELLAADANAAVRKAALTALSQLAPAEEIVGTFKAYVKDSDKEVARTARQMLRKARRDLRDLER